MYQACSVIAIAERPVSSTRDTQIGWFTHNNPICWPRFRKVSPAELRHCIGNKIELRNGTHISESHHSPSLFP